MIFSMLSLIRAWHDQEQQPVTYHRNNLVFFGSIQQLVFVNVQLQE